MGRSWPSLAHPGSWARGPSSPFPSGLETNFLTTRRRRGNRKKPCVSGRTVVPSSGFVRVIRPLRLGTVSDHALAARIDLHRRGVEILLPTPQPPSPWPGGPASIPPARSRLIDRHPSSPFCGRARRTRPGPARPGAASLPAKVVHCRTRKLLQFWAACSQYAPPCSRP